MLLVFFIFKGFGFALVGLGLNFTLLRPSSGYLLLSFIYLMGAKCLLSSTYGHQVVICVFSIHVLTKFPVKIILPYFGYQLNFCKFCVGLTFPMTKMEASTQS